jgi:hypothetical protein
MSPFLMWRSMLLAMTFLGMYKAVPMMSHREHISS